MASVLSYRFVPCGQDGMSSAYMLTVTVVGSPGGVSNSASVMLIPGDTARSTVDRASVGRSDPSLEGGVRLLAEAVIAECGLGGFFTWSPEGERRFRARAAVICFEHFLRSFKDPNLSGEDAIDAVKRVMAVEPVIKS